MPAAVDRPLSWLKDQPTAVLAAALILVALAAVVITWLAVGGKPDPSAKPVPVLEAAQAAGVSLDHDSSSVSQMLSSVAPATVLVHVAGAVTEPGLVSLSSSARVAEAVMAVGGFEPTADVDRVNLAARVSDGERLFIPFVGSQVPVVDQPQVESGPSGPGAPIPGAKVSINNASQSELETLPGVGPATATAIVEYRQRAGPFKALENLMDVSGIGPAKFDAVKDLITL